ncbi:hypothetical protein BRADI_1g33906v3 [Brachypodium distachyon]|uniref:Uncharacterized protein n=1 Tax=Brachypodium distachyon TaxID=15368 RepID=A0A0Q3L2A2_BRADI|nr:hypothetical protein BRADI_1g33906v3 [Brachypodium distachyon]
MLCELLAIIAIPAGATALAIYLIDKPKMPEMVINDARLSKAAASFSGVTVAAGFLGVGLAHVEALPFTVAPGSSSAPQEYGVAMATQGARPLDPGAARLMAMALEQGVVPLDVSVKARTRWRRGVFLLGVRIWTRASCRVGFFFPGNGTAVPFDRDICHAGSS